MSELSISSRLNHIKNPTYISNCFDWCKSGIREASAGGPWRVVINTVNPGLAS